MAGGINNFSPMIGNNASQLMKNLQQLIAANPAYLTSGIPTHLIQQMWKKDAEPAMVQQPKVVNNRINHVCSLMSLFIFFIAFERLEKKKMF
jgi:hypothetical protein